MSVHLYIYYSAALAFMKSHKLLEKIIPERYIIRRTHESGHLNNFVPVHDGGMTWRVILAPQMNDGV